MSWSGLHLVTKYFICSVRDFAVHSGSYSFIYIPIIFFAVDSTNRANISVDSKWFINVKKNIKLQCIAKCIFAFSINIYTHTHSMFDSVCKRSRHFLIINRRYSLYTILIRTLSRRHFTNTHTHTLGMPLECFLFHSFYFSVLSVCMNTEQQLQSHKCLTIFKILYGRNFVLLTKMQMFCPYKNIELTKCLCKFFLSRLPVFSRRFSLSKS